jgi:uncharacterized membrane protein YoaK (UPF0700 family)
MLTSRSNLALACSLSALAGYVDGIGFLHLGGLFVSFMSGNSTRLGIYLSDGHFSSAGQAIGLICLFVLGAACGSLIVLGYSRHRQCRVLLAEGSLLVFGAFCYAFGLDHVAISAIVLAMGLENAVFQIEGNSSLGLTYITGALVKVGQLLAGAVTGGERFAWLPNLLLWAALVAGAVVGASAYRWINLSAVWFAAAVAFGLAAVTAATGRH